MSELFAIQKNYEEANQYLQKALEIQQNSLPPDHSDFIKTYKDLCLSYYKLDKFKDALKCMEKANELRLKYLPAMKHSNADAASNQYQKRIQEANELLQVIQQREEKNLSGDNDWLKSTSISPSTNICTHSSSYLSSLLNRNVV